MTDANRPAGWYPDPAGAPVQRWWNGIGWGEQTRPGTGMPPPPPPPRRGSARRVVLIVLGALLALGAVLVGGLVWLVLALTGGPRGVVDDFYADLAAGQVEAAAARLCDRYAGDGVALLTAAYPDRVRNFDGDSVSRTGDTAVVTGSLETGSASAYRVTVRVVREQGEWKVCSLPTD